MTPIVILKAEGKIIKYFETLKNKSQCDFNINIY